MQRSVEYTTNDRTRTISELLGDKYDLIKGESVSNCKFKEKTGITSNNGSDYLLYYPYDEFFP